jgi:lipopolysaccharide/colanic/teichoic acid biosynthesis glycosyltransferase
LPLFPFIALLIKLDSRGPVFYTQQRMGRGSKPFRAWKLRTMTDGADRNNVHWTTDNDDRITRVGRIVRKTRLDEVPQLLNIFKGEMSLIGPRPEALSLVEMYTREIPYYPERHMVTPGITGWAQINYPYGNSIEDTRQKLMYDFYYIKNRSVILDLMIFLRTIRIVLTGKGAM